MEERLFLAGSQRRRLCVQRLKKGEEEMGERVWGSPRVWPLFVYVQRAGPWLGGNGSRTTATIAHHHRSSLTTGERNGTEKQRKAKKAKQNHRIYGPAPHCLGDLYNGINDGFYSRQSIS